MYGRDLIVGGQVKPEDNDHKGNEPENEHETKAFQFASLVIFVITVRRMGGTV
jgi:hypothetical protein